MYKERKTGKHVNREKGDERKCPIRVGRERKCQNECVSKREKSRDKVSKRERERNREEEEGRREKERDRKGGRRKMTGGRTRDSSSLQDNTRHLISFMSRCHTLVTHSNTVSDYTILLNVH